MLFCTCYWSVLTVLNTHPRKPESPSVWQEFPLSAPSPPSLYVCPFFWPSFYEREGVSGAITWYIFSSKDHFMNTEICKSWINHSYRSGFIGRLNNVHWQFVLLFIHPLAQHVFHTILMAIFWKKKIIIHLTERNNQYCATVITTCYLYTHQTFYCILLLLLLLHCASAHFQ